MIPSLKLKKEIWRDTLMAVTLSTLFLSHLMEEICTFYALNLFIVEAAWVRNMFEDGKYSLVASTEFLESQCKTFLKTLWFFNYSQFPNFDWLFTGLNWPIHRKKREWCTFRPGNCIIWYYLISCFSIFFPEFCF